MIKRIDLNGAWTLRQDGERQTVPATVPGCVHTALLAAGAIPDPFVRDNEALVQWVARERWIYERTFTWSETGPFHAVLLRCEGLDTLATVRLNGEVVGRADNMHRTWEFDVRAALRKGRNTLAVTFDSAQEFIESRDAERRLPGWHAPHEPSGRPYLRKMASSFGWDWAPVLPGCGIWRSIGLVACETARIEDVRIRQDHQAAGGIGLDVTVAVERRPDAPPLDLVVKLAYKGTTMSEARGRIENGAATTLRVLARNAQLWWPNGLGEQPLYEIVAEISAGGQPLDVESRRIGLRTLRLERRADAGGESFHFVVNGVPFFAKGANWVPADSLVTRMTRVEYARLIKAAAVANMNMLRVWGGGIYENDCFYDLCDEYGICVWQDFMFACATYPTFDDAWMENVRIEAEQNVRRLRHHPALALWVGNNELEQGLVGDAWTDRQMSWEDYGKLFDRLLPDVVQRLDPDRDYWPGSPHTPPPGDRSQANDADRGDAHLWQVWHGRQPFEWYRSSQHRFCSEFGFQSFPEPQMVAGFTAPEDRNVSSYVMEKHQRSGNGNALIVETMLSWFRMPAGFDFTLWLSQIQQGLAMKYAVEHWRRNRPRCMGALYWQLNDCWPVASWSSIDYAGHWKALHYLARRFYAPVLISAVEDPKTGIVEVHLTNDNLKPFKGEVQWHVTRADGALVREASRKVRIEPNGTQRLGVLKLGDLLKKLGPRDVLVWLTLLDEEAQVQSANLVYFCRPKHIEMPDPRIKLEIRPWDDNSYAVTLTARHPAFWVWLSLDGMEAKYDDNFFCLEPGRPTRIRVTPVTRLKQDVFRHVLRVQSIRDTYQEPARPHAAPGHHPHASPAPHGHPGRPTSPAAT